MNIEHAKTIPLREILEKIGISPTRETSQELWYLSPFRKEKTPSFHIHKSKNIWYDFGAGQGGDSIAFVQMWLKTTREHDTVSDVLRWLSNMMQHTPLSIPYRLEEEEKHEAGFILKKVAPVTHIALTQYLQSRGISLDVAIRHLKEVTVYNKAKSMSFFALGFANEGGGYELRNPHFKGCLSPKDVSFIRGKHTKPDGIHIFEGFMDYLSIITERGGKPLENDAIILNTLSKLNTAMGYIKGYGYQIAFTWFDNDNAGINATKKLKPFLDTEGIELRKMNARYHPHKDVNAWHMHKLGLNS